MPPKKKSVKKTKKIKKAKFQKEQKVKLFADFDVLGEEKKENESTSLSPDIQNDNIILKLEDDESDKNSPDVSAHTSHIEATEIVKEDDSEETVELSLEPKTQGEDDEDDEDDDDYEELDEDEDDEEEECYATTCPECEEEIFFDDSVLKDGKVECPNCGATLEFDPEDLVEDEEKDD